MCSNVAANIRLTVHSWRAIALAEQFLRATKAAVHGQKKANLVTPLQVDILFALFDDNGECCNLPVVLRYAWRRNGVADIVTSVPLGDGFLSPTEFIDVMQKRKDGGFNAV